MRNDCFSFELILDPIFPNYFIVLISIYQHLHYLLNEKISQIIALDIPVIFYPFQFY